MLIVSEGHEPEALLLATRECNATLAHFCHIAGGQQLKVEEELGVFQDSLVLSLDVRQAESDVVPDGGIENECLLGNVGDCAEQLTLARVYG